MDFQFGPTLVTAGNFDQNLLDQDIQVKEGAALKETLSMLIDKAPLKIKGKTLICKIDNMVLKAVLEKQGTSANLALNDIGKLLATTARRLQYLTVICSF